jgi:hypothetical protein
VSNHPTEGRGEYNKAEPLYREALEVRQKVLGHEHLLTGESLINLAGLYSLFVALGESDPLLAGAVLHYKGVVLDSIVEDRLLAEAGKEEANQGLVGEFKTKRQAFAQLSLQATAASSKETHERIRALEQEVESVQDKLARQLTDIGQARRALTVTVEQVQAGMNKHFFFHAQTGITRI